MEGSTGIVLAGGQSRRLGRDKSDELLDGTTLLQRSVDALASICSRVLVIASPGRRLRLEFSVASALVLADEHPGRGPLEGLRVGLTAPTTHSNIVVGCDMPFINPGVCRLLLGLAQEKRALDMLNLAKSPGLVDLLHLLDVRYVEVDEFLKLDPDLLSFFNVNTESDLAVARALLAEQEEQSGPSPMA